MWSDNKTGKDTLNFSSSANTVADTITQVTGRPAGVDISDLWDADKSSMTKFFRVALAEKGQSGPVQYQAHIVPKINEQLKTNQVFMRWENTDANDPVERTTKGVS